MKNSKEYSKKIKKLFSELKRNSKKVKKEEYDDPIEALVYASISEHTTVSTANAVYKRIFRHIVDFNDLRVSRAEEVIDVLGAVGTDIEKIVKTLKSLLQAVFNKYDRPSLVALNGMGKKQAREILKKLESISPFVINYIVLTTLKGHAVPLTTGMIEYLKAGDYVNPDSDEKDITSFLERQITAASAYNFHFLLRQASESNKVIKKKTAKKKVTKKRTKSKTRKKK
jgi:hypothetical protein